MSMIEEYKISTITIIIALYSTNIIELAGRFIEFIEFYVTISACTLQAAMLHIHVHVHT